MAKNPNPDGDEPKRGKALSAQQERFVEEFIKCRKGAEAARRAGYTVKSAHVAASRLLSNDKVREEINHRTKESKIETVELMARLGDIARGTMEDFVSFSYEPYPDFVLDLGKARERNQLHLIRELSYDQYGRPRIKLYSALEAQKVLAQLTTDAPSGSKDDPIHNVNLTLEEWRKEQAKRRSQAADTMDIFDDEVDDSSGIEPLQIRDTLKSLDFQHIEDLQHTQE